MAKRVTTGPLLRGWLWAGPLLGLIAPHLLKRRLKRGKEDPARMGEKLAHPTAARPAGRLVWMHAVGLGEVLALRGLIDAMLRHDPDLHFLVTSTARSSAQVMGANLPPNTQHQYLPIDSSGFMARFLDHWRPDLSVWAEQELWPAAVVAAHKRGIPLALVNARITDESLAKRQKARGLYRDLLSRFALITAQEDRSAVNLTALGAQGVTVTGSMKLAAPPLAADADALAAAEAAVAGRKVWVAASTHADDEAQVLGAHKLLWKADPARLLILVPRDISRVGKVASALHEAGLPFARRSLGREPQAEDAVWLADSYGELGLWYRLADTALIGGSFGSVGGHNPWEAASLGAAVLHGPDTRNFARDYQALDAKDAARKVAIGGLAAALGAADLPDVAARATLFVNRAKGALDPMAVDLLDLMRSKA